MRRTQESIEKHRKELIYLYQDQYVNRECDTTFMKAVLQEAINLLHLPETDPKKIEDWVVKHEKEIVSIKAFKL